MFKTWLESNTVSAYSFAERLFPLASDRAFWEAAIPDSYVGEAEAYLGYEWPLIRATQYMAFQQSGDRLVQETPHFNRRAALMALFLGELREDKGRFLPDLTDGIFAICEESFWGLSAHNRHGLMLPPADDPYVDLCAGDTAELLSVIYHVLYERLAAFCPLILTRIEYEMNTRVIEPYLVHTDWWWQGYRSSVNNWNPWVLQNILTAAVLMPIAKETRAAVIEKTMTEIERYYESMPEDGGCDEGTSYWTKAGAKLFMYCDVLYRASNGAINFFHDTKLKNIGLYAARAYITDCRFVNFADGAGLVRNQDVLYPLYGFGLRTGADEMCRFAGTLKRRQQEAPSSFTIRGISAKQLLWALIYADEMAAEPDFEPLDCVVLPDLQNAFLREGRWYLAAKGGHNAESHNHNDVGSFIVYADEQPLLVDPGVGVYTRDTFSDKRYTIPTMQSAYHNVPLINGVMQQNGAEFKASSFTAEQGRVEVQFADAYPSEARVRDIRRTITVNENGVTVEDLFAFDGAGEVCEHFLTPLSVDIQGDTAILGGKYRLRAEGAVASVDTMAFGGDAHLLKAWGQDSLNRVRFTTADATVHITLEGVEP